MTLLEEYTVWKFPESGKLQYRAEFPVDFPCHLQVIVISTVKSTETRCTGQIWKFPKVRKMQYREEHVKNAFLLWYFLYSLAFCAYIVATKSRDMLQFIIFMIKSLLIYFQHCIVQLFWIRTKAEQFSWYTVFTIVIVWDHSWVRYSCTVHCLTIWIIISYKILNIVIWY